ncbi:MAG TPA: alpha/beta fold hydrolase [Candidatus Deferrimicrobiaceae bacterium]|nr:alpha/beta fold hydrolase [Candidatus Deferrimicrobiaceae bacterium]
MTTAIRAPGVVVTEREHVVPLDHAAADGPTISVFTREVADPDGLDKPYLVFLQGGPGGEATRPTAPTFGWLKRALKDYRLLLLDQRGTGRSTPVADIPGDTPADQAAYLTHFRADSIVRDAELIRQELGVDRWSMLGQSFGGFCSMTYLSFAPEGLREVYITGGLSPIGRSPDDVYAATYRRLIQKNEAYFARYPADRARIEQIIRRLDEEDVRLPTGDRLTSRRFRQLGLKLGMSDGFEAIHHVVELPFGSRAFLFDLIDGGGRFERNPIYATLHESSYADGHPTRWSAARLLPEVVEARGYLTAEHVFPWMWDDYAGLQSHREAAHLLAEQPWPKLYDADQLARNEVPVAATIYSNDLYVERDFAVETARAIRGLRTWETDEFEHNGLRADGDRVLGRLIDLARGRA